MDERRKIVIPIGNDPDPKSEQTFFDTQSRKDARPVVPLSEDSKTGPAVPAGRSRKKVLLVVVLVAAVAAGGTAGVYAYMSSGRQKDGPQAAVQPVAGKALSTLSWTYTPKDPDADEDVNEDETQAQADQTANEDDPKKASKQQKPGKPGKKNSNKQSDDPIKQTQDELHRIREIFEGPP